MVRSRRRLWKPTFVLSLVSFQCLSSLCVASFAGSGSSVNVLRRSTVGLSPPRQYMVLKKFDSQCNDIRRTRAHGRFSGSTRFDATIGGDDTEKSEKAERNIGILVLFTVPLAWGTFEPAVRYVYAIDPPIPSLVFTVGYYLVASLSLLLLATTTLFRGESGETLVTKDKNNVSDENASLLNEGESSGFPIRGGIELGTYLFFGNGLQVLGLKTVPSDRAAFLLQLTTIMVPLVQAIIAGDLSAIPTRTWIACFVALGGVAVMSLDGQDVFADGSALSFSGGDFLIVLAAFSYTFHCIRLGKYAKETTPIKLGASKATTETLLSAALLAGIMWVGNNVDRGSDFLAGVAQSRTEIVSWFTAIVDGVSSGSTPTSVLLPAVGAVFWTGWITIAYTITAQSYGQRLVNPTDANLIYTVQPIFTALFAWALLGETLGTAGYAGGAMILSAVYLVASMEEESDEVTTKQNKSSSKTK